MLRDPNGYVSPFSSSHVSNFVALCHADDSWICRSGNVVDPVAMCYGDIVTSVMDGWDRRGLSHVFI